MKRFYYLQCIRADWSNCAMSRSLDFLRKQAELHNYVYWRVIDAKKRVILKSPALLALGQKIGG